MGANGEQHNDQEKVLKLLRNTKDYSFESKTEVPLKKPWMLLDSKLRSSDVCFYQVKQLCYEEDYPHREAFENVLSALDNEDYNFVYLLTGTEKGITLHIGVVKNHAYSFSEAFRWGTKQNTEENGISANDYGATLASLFEGNFFGSRLECLKADELRDTVFSVEKYTSGGVLVGVPAQNQSHSDSRKDYQGIERLINSLSGKKWRLEIVCEPVSREKILQMREQIYAHYDNLSVFSKTSVQKSVGSSDGSSQAKSESTGRGKNMGTTDSQSASSQSSKSTQSGTSESFSSGVTETTNKGTSSGQAWTAEQSNKYAQELMKYIDENLLTRLRIGFNRGLYHTSVYYMASNQVTANQLRTGLLALYQGEQSEYSPLSAMPMDFSDPMTKQLLCAYKSAYSNSCMEPTAALLLSRPCEKDHPALGTYMTGMELSLLAGLPETEVPGLPMRAGARFGLNQTPINEPRPIRLGVMVQQNKELSASAFYLGRKSLKKHTFVAGVTGSGKTTTCHRLLAEAKVPFLVIEPAKTEYRVLLKSEILKDVTVFTLGNEAVAPFRINPFELEPGEVISSHIDMLKATFTNAFPMEASMPQLLEEAIYKCYEDKGWNIYTNQNDIYGDAAFDGVTDSFPILSDLLSAMESTVEKKGFSERLKSDYVGSLVSRLSNLTVGSKGSMLNCRHSVNFGFLAENNVILEMEDLRSAEDKALLMGMILMRLSTVIRSKHRQNPDFRHLTLVEEAHRLLSRPDFSDSGAKKAAVETFSDLLAEVRKYGEGLIVVDQIPNKLAPEVLKNTNTKIIHRIFAKDDKDAIGDMMLMGERQREYLSALPVGHAVIFSENTDKPVHVRIEKLTDTDDQVLPDTVVRKRFLSVIKQLGSCFRDLAVSAYFDLFDEAAKELSRKKCPVHRKKLINAVKGCARNDDPRPVWRMLAQHRREHLGRKSDREEALLDQLADFFTDEFSANSFHTEDISITILTALM
ncbi:MAG: DUF87 domain-containing protein [Clostridia bacterium]|nr:DUF87 domain-containing protein [Clostridia bacterium]